MKFSPPAWMTPLMVLGYIVVANLALASGSAALAALATALLIALFVPAIPRAWAWLRIAVVFGGIWVALGVARGALPPVALLLPPLIVPTTLAWMFGHTLFGDRIALVERFARAVHAPDPLDARHAAYARGVTVMWTALLVALALANLVLVTCLWPGGLLHAFGVVAPWRVDVSTFLWIGNGTYMLIAVTFVVEFLFRRWYFPGYRLRDPREFLRRARERLPAVMEDLRRG